MNHVFSKIAFAILIIAFYLLGLRGSVGPVPISRNENTSISSQPIINDAAMNSLFALNTAIHEYFNSKIIVDSAIISTRFKFDSFLAAAKAYHLRDLTYGEAYDSFWERTPKDTFLESYPPNVVLVLVESLSNYYTLLDSADFNLLGGMRDHYREDMFFQRFLPFANGTLNSLEGLLLSSPQNGLSGSTFMEASYSTSIAKPFHENGYRTAFITAGKEGWQNFNKFIPKQYFDDYLSSSYILGNYPDAVEIEWGTLDGYLYQCITDQLKKDENKPLFIFALTVSNHTPYDIPASHLQEDIQIPQRILEKISIDEKIARKNFNAYRYTNDQLAKFISGIKNSRFGENTIIAVTGDHNTRHLLNFREGKQLFLKHSVPFYLYVPEAYRKGVYHKDRPGSHKDIGPTLNYLALSEATYFNGGNNLLADTAYFFGVNYFGNNELAIDQYGCGVVGNGAYFLKWTNPGSFYLESTSFEERPELRNLQSRANALSACLYYFNQQDLYNYSKK